MKAIKSVYCYYFPEVRKIVDEVASVFPHDKLLKSIFPGLDNFHQPFVAKFVEKSKPHQKGLDLFPNQYITNGSSEGIFHLLVDSIFHNNGKPIYVLEGEYEGYREYAKNIGGQVIEVEDEMGVIERLKPGRWFISNPSARDGNLLARDFLNKLGDLGHEIVVDMAYLGMTRIEEIDLTHPNIIAVVASMSKPFGMFYFRVGMAFCKKPMPTLYANKWFKNIFSIIAAEKVLEKFGLGYYYKKYRIKQLKAVRKLGQEVVMKVIPSDVLILATTPKNEIVAENLKDFKRGKNYRFCLTPYFLEMEKNKIV